MFIKVDTGCLDEINDQTHKNIEECFIYIVLLCCIILLTEFAYIVQFYLQCANISSRGQLDSNDLTCSDIKGDMLQDYNATGADSYLQMSGFTSSLQTSCDSSQASNRIDPDNGPRAAFGMPISMESYDPMVINASAVSSGMMNRQRSLNKLNSSQQIHGDSYYGNQSFGGQPSSNSQDYPTSGEFPTVVASSSDMDRFGKKKKAQKQKNDKNAAELNGPEVFVTPGTIIDFQPDYLVNDTLLMSPTDSSDSIENKLADNSQPQKPDTSTPQKKKFGLNNLNIKPRRHH